MNYEEMIDGYNNLREKCLKLAKQNNGRLMGTYSWLQNAIGDSDITLWFYEDGIECSGMTYTTQTMSDEPFSFMIPIELLKENDA